MVTWWYICPQAGMTTKAPRFTKQVGSDSFDIRTPAIVIRQPLLILHFPLEAIPEVIKTCFANPVIIILGGIPAV